MSGQGSVNTLNPAVDLTVRVYDEFYEFAVDVDATVSSIEGTAKGHIIDLLSITTLR